jgi:hypothetical protein
MTTSQSDVDKVMAAFGAAPLNYRPNQELAARPDAETRAESTGGRGVSSFVVAPAPLAHSSERILPGAGGRVREIFPLLWRAIPVVGDLKIGAIKRAGDEVPEATEPDSSDDGQLAARIQAASATMSPAPAATVTGRSEPQEAVPARPLGFVQPVEEAPPAAPAPARVVPLAAAHRAGWPPHPPPPEAAQPASRPAGSAKTPATWPFLARGETPRVAALPPTQWEQPRRDLPSEPPPPQPVAVLPVASPASTTDAGMPLPPLRSHTDLIRPVVRRALAAEAAPAVPTAPPPPQEPAPLAVPPRMPPTAQFEAQPAAPQPAAPQPAYPGPAYPPPPPGYPPYYPAQALPPYPMHPPAMAWPPAAMMQPGLPPQGYPPFYGPVYAPPAPGYPPYPTYPLGYPPPYPYGYAQPPQPPQPGPQAVYEPQPYLMAPQPAPMPEAAATLPPGPQPLIPPLPQPAANLPPQPAPPTSLSDIFAALHRAPNSPRGEGTPP